MNFVKYKDYQQKCEELLLYYIFYNFGYSSLNNNVSHQVKTLLKLAARNKSKKIYTILNNLNGSTTFKGDVFEYFLAELYEKIGWNTKIIGGKDDQGVDILLFDSRRKVKAIIQAKNTKRPLPKKEMVNEYDNFIGIYNSLGAAKKYACDTLIIFSLNGYTKGAWNYNHPATHKIYRYEWAYIEKLIKNYAKHKFTVKKIPVKKSNKFVNISIVFVFLASLFIYNSSEFPTTLTSEMIARLNRTAFSSLVKQDCKRLNYPLESCRQKLVSKYTRIHGSLQKGLIAYFCGPTNFKNGICDSYGEKMADYIADG
ncbi:restriction endonuclease [Candidatus Halobeggiatoa sp. HSG11]|nr:restriction endonuclease [Candidatus Halobeggiatoa sp. HSG11]